MTRSKIMLAGLALVALTSAGCSLVLDSGRHMGGTGMDGGGTDAGVRPDAPVGDAGMAPDGCVSADPCDCDGDHFQAARAGCTPALDAIDCCDDGTEPVFGGCNVDRAQYIHPGALPYCIEADLISNDCNYLDTAGLRTLLNVGDVGMMPSATYAGDAPSGIRPAIALAIRRAIGPGPFEPLGLGYVGYIDGSTQRARIVSFDVPFLSVLEGEPAIMPPGDQDHTGVALARVGGTETTVAAHILLSKLVGTDGPFMWAGYFDPANTDGRGTALTDLGTASGTGTAFAQSVITRGATSSRHFIRVQNASDPLWAYGSLPYGDLSLAGYNAYPAAGAMTDATVVSGAGFVHVAATHGPYVLVELDATHLEAWDTQGTAIPFPVLEDTERTGRAAISRPGSGSSFLVYPAGMSMRVLQVSAVGAVVSTNDFPTPGAANLVAAAPISRDGFVIAYTTSETPPLVRLMFVSTPSAAAPEVVAGAHLGVVSLPDGVDAASRVFTDLQVDVVSLETGGIAIVVAGTYGSNPLSPRGIWTGGLYGCTR